MQFKQFLQFAETQTQIDESTIWKEIARLCHEADKEFASQIGQIVSLYPERTRLMGLVGTGYTPMSESLPPNLQSLCEVVKLTPDAPISNDEQIA